MVLSQASANRNILDIATVQSVYSLVHMSIIYESSSDHCPILVHIAITPPPHSLRCLMDNLVVTFQSSLVSQLPEWVPLNIVQ